MADLPQQIIGILGPLGAILLGLTVWMFIIGTPVLFVLAIRFLWYRHVYVGRSGELDKLIWQLHRIASALETPSTASTAPTATPEPARPREVVNSMFGR